MKFNFKKIAAIGASALMIGMSVGVAAAANFPAPFSGTATSTVAVVSGTGAGVDDTVATNSMANYLAGKVTSGGTTITGESHKFERASTKLWLGRGLLDISASTLDDDELPNLLADGTYTDNDNDEFDYSQKISVANLSLTLFDDNDYKRDTPTVGIKIDSNADVLNYTLEFVEDPYWDDLVSTDLTIMGKDYFVLSTADNDTLNLLDSGETTVLSEGETVTVGGKQVSISYVSETEVKLLVDGTLTNSLGEGDTQKLSGGSYVGIKDIMYVSKESGVSKVEFSIGSGKLVIANGDEVEMNEEDVDGLTAEITNSNSDQQLASITLIWNADEEAFIAPDSEVTMPGFETVKFSMGGMVFPVEEEIGVESDGNDNIALKNFPLKETTYSINLLESNGTNYTLIGKDSDNRFATAYAGQNLTFVKGTDDYFVISYASGEDAESYLIRASSFGDGPDDTSGTADDIVTFQYMVSGTWKDLEKDADVNEVVSAGSLAEFTVKNVNDSTDTVIVSATSPNNFHMLYSAEGLEVWLPWMNVSTITVTGYITEAGCIGNLTSRNTGIGQLGSELTISNGSSTTVTCYDYPATYDLMFEEETKDGTISDGNAFNLTLGLNTQTPKETTVNIVVGETPDGGYEIGEDDIYRSFVYGALATEIKHNTGGDQDTVVILYHGSESYGEVYLSEVGASLGGAEAGSMVFTDAEKVSWQGRNVVLVGGSCINEATAQALGVAYPTCETAFTTATGVGSGQYLIKSVGNAFTSGKIALVVAGYSKADTQAAVNRLIQPGSEVDTTAGKAYLGIVGATGTSTLAPM